MLMFVYLTVNTLPIDISRDSIFHAFTPHFIIFPYSSFSLAVLAIYGIGETGKWIGVVKNEDLFY